MGRKEGEVMAGNNGSGLLSRDDILSGKALRWFSINTEQGAIRVRHAAADELLVFLREDRDAREALKGRADDAPLSDDEMRESALRTARRFCRLAIDDKGNALFSPDDAGAILEKLSLAMLSEAVQKSIAAANDERVRAGES